jgi:hypothetical protein
MHVTSPVVGNISKVIATEYACALPSSHAQPVTSLHPTDASFSLILLTGGGMIDVRSQMNDNKRMNPG